MADSVRKIFISYRRDDHPDFVDRIRDWFITRYGRANVFMDFDSIPPFTKFADYIRKKVEETEVMIVIIGPKWLELLREKAANFQEDFVRIEVATAIDLGKILAPICIKDAKIPPINSLPQDLRSLLDHNIAYLDSGRDFLDNIQKLVEAVEEEFSSLDQNRNVTTTKGDQTNLEKSSSKPTVAENLSYDEVFARGVEKSNNGDLDGAISDFKLAIQIKPNSFEPYNNIGTYLNQKGDYEEAITYYDKAIAVNPQADYSYVGRAASNLNLGNYKEAIADCNKAIQLDTSILDQTYYVRGIARFSLEDIEGAVGDYTQAIEYNSQLIDAYWRRAEINRHDEKFEEAIEDYETIIAINPEYIDAYTTKGDILWGQEKWHDLISLYTDLIENNLQNPEGYSLRAGVYDETLDYDAAIADYTKAIQLDPINANNYYYWRGQIREKNGDHSGAIKDYTTAIRLFTDNKSMLKAVYERRADIYTNLERYQEAINDLDTIRDLYPNSTLSRILEHKIEAIKKNIP